MADCCVEEAATLARLLSEVTSILAATFCVYSFLVLGIIMSLMGKLKMASVLNHGKLLNRSSPSKYCTNMLAVVSPNPRGFFFSVFLDGCLKHIWLLLGVFVSCERAVDLVKAVFLDAAASVSHSCFEEDGFVALQNGH